MKLPKLRGRKKKAAAVDQEEDLTIRERLERGRDTRPDDTEVPAEASEALEATEPVPEETAAETGSGEPEPPAEKTASPADGAASAAAEESSDETAAETEETSAESGESGESEASEETADEDDDSADDSEEPEEPVKKKKSGKKKLVLLGMLIVVIAAAAGVFLLRDRLPIQLPFGGGGDDSAASSSASSSASSAAGSQSAASSPPEDSLTLVESVDYINTMSPAALGLPGDSMTQYEVLPNEGTVLVDGMPCTELSVYAKDDVTDTNDYMGSYLLSRGSPPRIFRLDKETGQATEISTSSDVGQAVLTQAAEED